MMRYLLLLFVLIAVMGCVSPQSQQLVDEAQANAEARATATAHAPTPTPTATPAPPSTATAAPSPTPDAMAPVSGVEDARSRLDALESIVFSATNQIRNDEGVPSLEHDSELSSIARRHSQDMAVNDFFSHDNLTGQDPSARAMAAGYDCRKDFGSYYTEGVAENLWQGWLYLTYREFLTGTSYDYLSPPEIGEGAVSDLYDSPGHKANMLSTSYDKIGIGVAISDDMKVYVTQKFC